MYIIIHAKGGKLCKNYFHTSRGGQKISLCPLHPNFTVSTFPGYVLIIVLFLPCSCTITGSLLHVIKFYGKDFLAPVPVTSWCVGLKHGN